MMYDLDSSTWTRHTAGETCGSPPSSHCWPPARFGHAAAALGSDQLLIHGGQGTDRRLLDDLWAYNITSGTWRALPARPRPTARVHHTLTAAPGGQLYLRAGAGAGDSVHGDLWRLTVDSGDAGDLEGTQGDATDPERTQGNAKGARWTLVSPRGGRQLDLRLVGHSTLYLSAADSLLVYGGLAVDVDRVPMQSDRLFVLHLRERVWSELAYPPRQELDTHVPRERAFHAAQIAGESSHFLLSVCPGIRRPCAFVLLF